MHKHIKHAQETIFQKVWEKRVIIILLIAIFLIAFGIRAHLLRYNYLFEFDAFYHARLVEQIVKTGSIVNPDPLAYYQQGGSPAMQMSLYHVVSALLYNIISFGQPFNRELFLWAVQFFPVVFGSIITVLLYFLGKEVFNNKKVGIIMAFIGAVTPAFAYRTMAGAQGDNSFGFIWLVLGFIFFIKAVKTGTLQRKDVLNTVLSGIFCGAMVLSWNMYPLIPLILIAYTFFALLIIACREKEISNKILENPVIILFLKFLVVMIIFHLIASLYGTDWIDTTFAYIKGAFNAVSPLDLDVHSTAIISFAGVIASLLISYFISKTSTDIKALAKTGSILLLYFLIAIVVFAFLTVPDLFYMHGGRDSIASMVGEESVGNSFFGTKYNSLIIFPWMALIVFPITLWLYKKNDSHTGILFFFWIMLTLAMAWYKLKFTFVFGLAIAPAAAIVAYALFEGLKKFNIEKGVETKVIFVSIFLLILFGVGASAKFFPDYTPYVDQHPEWLQAMNWIKANTPLDAKLLNWWDQGHILAWVTERKVSTDNRNVSYNANKGMASFVVLEDTNKAYTIAAKEFDADYVILESDMFYQGASFEFYELNKVTYSDPSIQKYGEGIVNIIGCSEVQGGYSCGRNQIAKDQFEKLPTKWNNVPLEFYNGKFPEFIYRNGNSLVVLNNAMNNSNLAKVWFNSSETSAYYEEVFSNGQVKIFKIKK
jgi:dolichyl-diphosphooligosaccharide--protein glycosyltransferase